MPNRGESLRLKNKQDWNSIKILRELHSRLTLGSTILLTHKCIVDCVGVPFTFEAFGRFFVNLPINVSDGGCTFKLHVAVFGRKMLPLSLQGKQRFLKVSQFHLLFFVLLYYYQPGSAIPGCEYVEFRSSYFWWDIEANIPRQPGEKRPINELSLNNLSPRKKNRHLGLGTNWLSITFQDFLDSSYYTTAFFEMALFVGFRNTV